ncbi:MAG TPA: hypothetical protein VMN58_09000 [Acidimicrobiales bacterium]|nr:hypothetical protein [Acidimicrobiales bacterium]
MAWLLLRDEGNGDEADVVTDDTVPAEVEEQEPADEPPLDDAEPGDGQADNGTAPVDDAPVDDAPADDAPADDAPVDDGPGELRAGDEALFPVPDDLSAFEGDDVRGEGVLVHSVVEALGFWIGDDDENRIFVRVEPGLDTGGFVVEEGDRVDLEGTVRANDPDDVDPPDDAGGDRYREQGHHIELRSLEPAS